MSDLPDCIQYDKDRDILTVCGIAYAGQLWRDLGAALPIGQPFEVTCRDNGVLAVRQLEGACYTAEQLTYQYEAGHAEGLREGLMNPGDYKHLELNELRAMAEMTEDDAKEFLRDSGSFPIVKISPWGVKQSVDQQGDSK